eukprot:1001291_1
MQSIVLSLTVITYLTIAYRSARCDETEQLISEEGNFTYTWMKWYDPVYCDYDQWAIGFEFKSETTQLIFDDTAGNGVRLICSNDKRTKTEIIETKSPKHWGSWNENNASCDSNQLKGNGG